MQFSCLLFWVWVFQDLLSVAPYFANYCRYEMSNCLFEAAYEKIISDCNCMPSFHQLAHQDVSEICTGPGLTCMNKILRFIGKLNRVIGHHHERL